MKNIKAQSFKGHDFFTHPIINQKEPVQLKCGEFRNALTQSEWLYRVRYKARYPDYLSGMAIPLNIQELPLFKKARLVIAWPDDYGDVQISIQFLLIGEQKWVTVPCRTNTVCDTFYGLFPEPFNF